MGENQDLINLLGKIHQLIDYKIAGPKELEIIKQFCEEETIKLDTGEFIEREWVDWNEFLISEQYEEDNTLNPGLALEMTDRFQDNLEITQIYRTKLHISREVISDLFKNTFDDHIKIYLGENETGLQFLYKTSNSKFYIVHNKIIKDEISSITFDTLRTNYQDGALKKIIDLLIQKPDVNTLRFTISRTFFSKLESFSTQYPNIVIAFHPAIHTTNDLYNVKLEDGRIVQMSYENRLTFIMILKYYNGSELTVINEGGVYDRNGLCPPPANSNCLI